MGLTGLALHFAAPLPKIEDFSRFLFIGPHPDDIEIGAGASAAKLAAEGKHISFLICADGRFGLENAPAGTTPDELALLRKKEAEASARVLGVTDIHFLELCDGGFYEFGDLLRGIARVVGETQPECIFVTDPDVSSECHIDHRNAGEAARRIAYLAPFPEIMEKYGAKPANVKALAFYMTARPNLFVPAGGMMKKQFTAILCHRSQFTKDAEAFKSIALYLKLRAADHGLRALCGKAEGFRVLGRTQMHCLPEAGK